MELKLFTLVTGASSGLGREIAMQLSKTRHLILHGRDEGRLNETRNLCVNSEQHVLWPMDFGNLGSIEHALPELLRRQDLAIECFVHCAGTLKVMPMRMMELKIAHDIMNVNFHSALEIIRLLLKKTINGHHLKNIVFVSSTASKFGARGFNLYCASKGALDSSMRALAVELAPRIRVNSVLPAGVRTSMTEAFFEDSKFASHIEADSPLGLGKASDIAAAVEFLVSEKSRWITGQQLIVDGGQTVNITA